MHKRASAISGIRGAARRAGAFALSACLACSLLLTGCVDQHPERSENGDGSDEPRIIATSPAIAEVCDLLDLDLTGVPTTSRGLPDRYADVDQVGTAMSPDLEIVKSLRPDCVLSPNSLQSDLQPKFASIMVASVFLNLRSVQGMYDSIAYLGDKFDRKEQAQALVDEYEAFIEGYRAQNEGEGSPKVLVLMGVPGSYVVATPNSYVGSLVELAGGQNVYADSEEEFVNVNTEDMQARDPDIILRTSHALPSQVMAMFANEFATNDIWRHFRAVQEGQVYDLPSDKFGMSADFDYPDALEELRVILYGEEAGSDGTVVGEAASAAAAAISSSSDAGAVADAAAGIVGDAGSGTVASIVDKQE
ncbi:heme ABC transporter substrate-binding protein IsdE [Gordonibacter massiliensis (ex Traore et al. 2017)]|uniref:heme ABC transporter substrate-binding protein IsdE n=1 Tax=Gordonibacter massiliensis (ex Traore et al. 2017) TaxID=1841863 RepID=UPI001C8BE26F